MHVDRARLAQQLLSETILAANGRIRGSALPAYFEAAIVPPPFCTQIFVEVLLPVLQECS